MVFICTPYSEDSNTYAKYWRLNVYAKEETRSRLALSDNHAHP